METYKVIYTHQYGVDVMLVSCDRYPTQAEIIKALNIDFDENCDGEYLEWRRANIPVRIP